MKFIQNRLQATLDKEGLSQAELHLESRVNAATINQICKGRSKTPRHTTMNDIVNGLNRLVVLKAEQNRMPATVYAKADIFVQLYEFDDDTPGLLE